jgi:NitT/TauT family transport system ATP-binding protein
MRQRVAIARALVARPDFVHFDEPFTALDAALKRRMQDLMIEAAASGAFGALFVTHDLAEAARIAHRVAVMHPQGKGILGIRSLPGLPGKRDDAALFDLTRRWQDQDILFRHIHDVDERRIA